ncbi:MAG: hypothetical protein NVS3B11_14360 [Collimonas sp.]
MAQLSFRPVEDFGPTSLALMTNASPDQWVGRWGGGQVGLNIVSTQDEPPLLASVTDLTKPPFLLFSEKFTPGSESLLSAGARPIDSTVQLHEGGVAYLDNNIVMRLFGIFESGHLIGHQIQLQRLSADRNLTSTVTLVPIVDVVC